MEKIIIGILIPFLGTVMGSSLVFFMKNKINIKLHKFLLGFAAGIMIAASIWSLIIPAIEQGELMMKYGWIPAIIGLSIGFAFLFIVDLIVNKIDNKVFNNKSLMVFSITLHNIPEGMAVGVALAGAFYGGGLLSLSSAIILSLGIAIQNIPEGAIVSMPYQMKGISRIKAFSYGVYSGLVEPIFAIITFFITSFITSILPYILTFAAGSMLFVVVQEVIPEAESVGYSRLGTLGFALGFLVMLILDVSLG